MANARLHQAAYQLDLKGIKQALEEGANINSDEDPKNNLPGISGTTALHIIAGELGANKNLSLEEKQHQHHNILIQKGLS